VEKRRGGFKIKPGFWWGGGVRFPGVGKSLPFFLYYFNESIFRDK